MTTILIADDHAVVAQGLELLLKDAFEVIGIVHDGRALLDAVDKLCPDVVLTDISMPGLNGIEAIRKIREQQRQTVVIILTMHAEPLLAADAFRAGASGYVLKTCPGEELIAAIREVSQGRDYLTPLIARGLIDVLLESKSDAECAPGNLTSRQREVLKLLAEGKTMKEIARILHISPRTVESHKYEMMENLGITTSAELVQHAMKLGLVGG